MGKTYRWTAICSGLLVTILLFFNSLSVLALDVPSPPKNGYVLDQTQTLTKEEKKARFIIYINEHSADFKTKIDRFKLENSAKNIEELTYEKLEDLATFIKNKVEQKKGA